MQKTKKEKEKQRKTKREREKGTVWPASLKKKENQTVMPYNQANK